MSALPSRPPLSEIERQVRETRERGLRTLPVSWWEPAVAERISTWLLVNIPRSSDRLNLPWWSA